MLDSFPLSTWVPTGLVASVALRTGLPRVGVWLLLDDFCQRPWTSHSIPPLHPRHVTYIDNLCLDLTSTPICDHYHDVFTRFFKANWETMSTPKTHKRKSNQNRGTYIQAQARGGHSSPPISYELVLAIGEAFWLRSFAPWFLRVGNKNWHGCSWLRKKNRPVFFSFEFFRRNFTFWGDFRHLWPCLMHEKKLGPSFSHCHEEPCQILFTNSPKPGAKIISQENSLPPDVSKVAIKKCIFLVLARLFLQRPLTVCKTKQVSRTSSSCWCDHVNTTTLANSLLNMHIGMSIGWGIAYRYLLTPFDRYAKLSIDTYCVDQ